MRSSKILKNTLMLYIRQVIIALANIYAISVVLNVLGVEDYGIYYVVAGIVSLFLFLQGAMVSATQRFFSFALGEKNKYKLSRTFSSNLLVYIFIAIAAMALLESIGFWFASSQLNLPVGRADAAMWVYHFAVMTFMAGVLSTPFMAIIIAHEDMQYYSYISIVEAILKLLVAILVPVFMYDKLIMYAFLLFIVSLITGSAYLVVACKKYSECQIKKIYWDIDILKDITAFTSWTLFGQVSLVVRNQGVTILLNQSFDPVVVAARGIAVSVATQVNMFSNNFNVGLYPPIIKLYAAQNYTAMFNLIFSGSKMTFFLMWLFFLPLFLEMDTILRVWLNTPPLHTALFTKLALVEVLINSISLPLISAARAPGKMKAYELTLGHINLAILPLSWLALRVGFEAYAVFVIAILANILMFAARLYITRRLIRLSVSLFLKKVMIPILLVALSSMILPVYINITYEKSLAASFIMVFTCVFSAIFAMYFLGLSKSEKVVVKTYIAKFKKTRKLDFEQWLELIK